LCVYCAAYVTPSVARPQDSAKKGPGRIRFDGLQLFGDGTKFTGLKKGEKIRPGRSPNAYKVKQVISDTEALLGEELGEPSPLTEVTCQGPSKWVEYDIFEFIDQSKMFESVYASLASGGCIGIFPEGGSHDNTDLLPLKVS
jgi:glycerol-3-phosphate O-acyltransferase/dihydroxyacetone phosphate acyltransferase